MESCAVVATNVLTDGLKQRVIVVEGAAVDGIGLHGVEERFDEGVVADLAGALHALGDSEGCQAGPEGIGRVFHSAVGMKNQRRLAASPQPSTIEGIQGQRKITPEAQTPAEDPPRVSIQNYR